MCNLCMESSLRDSILNHSESIAKEKSVNLAEAMAETIWTLGRSDLLWKGRLNRPPFSRHLRVVHYGNDGGGYERQALYGRVQVRGSQAGD